MLKALLTKPKKSLNSNQSISLGKTLENYGTSGSVLVQEIQDEINLRNVPQGTCINGRKIIKYGVTEKC